MPASSSARLFLPFACGTFVGSFYRSVNAVVAPDMIAELHLTAESIGLLTSVFFLFYAGIQIPLGMLLDRFGARRVTATLYSIAAAACLVFAQASDFSVLLAARAVMGLGISVALMGSFKALVERLPRERLPVGNSLILAAGGLGIMAATVPVQLALEVTDWRGVFVGIAVATLAVVVAVIAFAPEKKRRGPTTDVGALRGVIQVLTSREFLRMVPLGSSAQGVNMAMSGLWAGPWLRDVGGLARDEVAAVLFAIAAMVTLSVLCIGGLAARLARAGVPILATACTGIAGFIVFEALIALDLPVSPYALWLPFALFATAPVLIYSVLATSFAPALAGRVNTAYNFVTFVFTFAIQWAVGAIIDRWPPLADGRFAPEGYRWALALIVVLQLAAFAWLLMARRLIRK